MSDLTEILHGIIAAADEEDAIDQFEAGFQELGPHCSFYCSGAPFSGTNGLKDKFQLGHIVGKLVNDEVSQTILNDPNLLAADKFPKYCKTNFLPLIWKCDPTKIDDAHERKFFSLPADFGITGGVTVPIHQADRKTYGNLTVFFDGRDGACMRGLNRVVNDIHVASLYLHTKLSETRREFYDGPPLSPRQKDCLSLLAVGLQASQIADRLTLSETTVREYLSNARKKLDARTSAEAVAVALQRRIIEL